MRKLNLKDYQVTQTVRSGNGELTEVTLPYRVKDSILNIMFLPQIGLQGAEAVRQQLLAVKIEQSKDEVMLEEEEYGRVKKAAEFYSIQSRADVELIDRILNQTLEEVEVEPKNNLGGNPNGTNETHGGLERLCHPE